MNWQRVRWWVSLGLIGITILISTPTLAQLASKPGDSVGTAGGACSSASINYAWPDASGHVLQCVSNVWTAVTQAGAPATPTGSVQFNNAGSLGGSANLFWNNSSSFLGIGTNVPANTLDVNGGVAVGTYAGANTAPANGLIVSGNLGIGSTAPMGNVDINGSLSVGSVSTLVPTTLNGTINASVTTITVVSTANYSSVGAISMNGSTEVMTYTGKTGTTFTGVTRGAYGTTASSHTTGVSVYGMILQVQPGNVSLANLVTKSLVTVEVGSVTAYYRLHETTRGYALEKLAESGEFEQVARRHANYYRDLFDSAETELETLPAPAWLARYGRHVGQARAALDWAFSPTGAAEVGVALTVAAVPLWVHLSLMEECRGRVERALSGPAESRDARRNMQLHAALGAVLFLTKGSGPETLAAWTSVFEIAESLDDVDYRLRALWGLFVDCITSGRYRAALAVAERFCTCAAKSTDPADGPIGNRLVGVALLALGDLEGARRHIERMLSGYVARGSHIIRFQYDQRVVARSYHSHVLWLQGFADQAMRSVECQVVNARASDHPVSLSHALLQAACPVALLVRDLTLAERYVKAIMDLSARHAVELWNVGGRCFAGMLLIKRGNIGAGLELLRTAFARVPENAFNLLYILFLDEIADALGRDGKAAEGLSTIDEALARSERTEERWCVAELLRIKGELILRKGAPQAATAAEEHFLRSLDWARRQGALSWELRTSTSLARLQHGQGRVAEARSLLKSVYDRFSEGFDTVDLKTAKTYLDSWR